MARVEGLSRTQEVSKLEEERAKKQREQSKTRVETSREIIETQTFTAPKVVITPDTSKNITREGPEHATNVMETVTVTTITPKEAVPDASKPSTTRGEIPQDPTKFEYAKMTPEQQAMVREQTLKIVVGEASLFAGVLAPTTALTGALIGTGVSEGVNIVLTGKPLTVEEVGFAAASGAVFNVAGSAIFKGVEAIPKVGPKIVGSAFGRIGVSTTIGAGGGYILSGGKTESALFGAGLGAAFGTGVETFNVLRGVNWRAGYEKVMTKLSPERAMYNRVVVENIASETPIGTKGWSERLLTKISPERAMYNRVFKSTEVVTPKSPETFSGGGGGGGTVKPVSTGKWVQQQVLFKEASTIQKVSMKPFTVPKLLPSKAVTLSSSILTSMTKTTAKTTPKITTKTVEKVTSTQKVVYEQPSLILIQNPFLKYGGKPFYGYRTRQEEEETVYPIVYPFASPLSSPTSIVSVSQIQAQAPKLVSLPASVVTVKPAVKTGLVTKQIPRNVLREEETLIQRQAQLQVVDTVTKTTPKYPQIPSFGLGGGGAGSDSFERLFSRWTPRTHNIKSWDKMLGTFGFGKVPKSVKSLSGIGTKKSKKKRRRKKR